MPTAGFRRIVATAGVLALTLGASTLVVTTAANAGQTMTATTYVNVRSGPGTSHPVIGVLSPGQAVEASGTVTNGWYEVTVTGTAGWVYQSYLKAPATTSSPSPATTAPPTSNAGTPTPTATGTTTGTPTPTTTGTATGTATATANVNVRTGPGTTYAVVGVASRGLQLSTTGATSGGWTQVLYDGTARWIATSYLTQGTVSSTPPTTTGTLRTTANLYLRTAGMSTAPYEGVLPANSVVDATGRTTADYSEIVHQGATRWIATRYTAPVTATSPSVPAAPTASGTVYVSVNTLNVRATSAPTGAVVGVVSRGAALPTTGNVEGDRTEVLYLGAARWVYTAYTSTTAPSAVPLSIPAGVTTSGMSQLNPHAQDVVSYVLANFPRIRTIYGWRASSAYSSDHPNGRAVDIMLPDWQTQANADYGWTVARYFAANAKTYKINYIIYRQSSFNAAYPERGWRPMEDRGGATANHYDHVHVSVFD